MDGCLCQYHWLGTLPYLAGLQIQERWAGEIAAGCRLPTLLLLEHPHTYTFGRSGKQENLLWNQAELEERGISLYWTDRGGDITYHGPGQLVGYPLLPLVAGNHQTETGLIPKRDYIGYLRKLEEVLVLALKQLNIPAQRIHGQTGVWVRLEHAITAKIASIGIKVDANGISRHGFCLNVSPDMSFWDGIIPCGLSGTMVTSIDELLKQDLPGYDFAAMQPVAKLVIDAFTHVFGFTMMEGKEPW